MLEYLFVALTGITYIHISNEYSRNYVVDYSITQHSVLQDHIEKFYPRFLILYLSP